MEGQPGFFDLAERQDNLSRMLDSLRVLKTEIDRKAFRANLAKINDENRKSAAGVKLWDVVCLFNVMIQQPIYKLPDQQIKYQIHDRFSFMRFLRLRM